MQKFCQLVGILKNKARCGALYAKVPFSDLNYSILKFFEKKGFLVLQEKQNKNFSSFILVKLIFISGRCGVLDWEIVSKPSSLLNLTFSQIYRKSLLGEEMLVMVPGKGLYSNFDLKKEGIAYGGLLLLVRKRLVYTKG